MIAAKAVCFAEDLTLQFKKYAAQVVSNARAMGERLKNAVWIWFPAAPIRICCW